MSYNKPIVGKPMDSLLKPDKGFLWFVRNAEWLSLDNKWDVIQAEHKIHLGVAMPEQSLYIHVARCYNAWVDLLEWHISGEPFSFPDSCYPQ